MTYTLQSIVNVLGTWPIESKIQMGHARDKVWGQGCERTFFNLEGGRLLVDKESSYAFSGRFHRKKFVQLSMKI